MIHVAAFELFAVFFGFLGHLTRPFMRQNFTAGGKRYDGWFAVLSYSIGVLMVLPLFLVAFAFFLSQFLDLIFLKSQRDQVNCVLVLAFVSWILSFFPYGIGTVIGHILLPDKPLGLARGQNE